MKSPAPARKTTKQVGAEYAMRVKVADRTRRDYLKQNPGETYLTLWRDAAADVARVCKTCTRARARARLQSLAKQFASMAISRTYREAAAALA